MTRAGPATSRQRCHQHPEREASARCPECRQPCCRQCVTEHEGRVLCSRCLARETPAARQRPAAAGSLAATLAVLLGIGTAWCFFGLIGRVLLSIPTPLHEGTVFISEPEDP